jgi:predicted HTH domain antitoxin
MQVAVELPEDVASELTLAWKDLSRGTLEAVALEGYRVGILNRGQVGKILDLSFWETEAFLKERQAYLAYTPADLEDDRRTLEAFGR